MNSRRRRPSSDIPARPLTTMCDSTFPLLLQGPEAGAVRPPHSILFLCRLGAAGGRAEALGSIPQGEREPRCAQSQSHEAWTSLPTWARGLHLFPGHHCLAKPSLDSGTQSTFAPSFLSVFPHEGPQKRVKRSEGALSGEVCLLPCTGGRLGQGAAAVGPCACPPKASSPLHS